MSVMDSQHKATIVTLAQLELTPSKNAPRRLTITLSRGKYTLLSVGLSSKTWKPLALTNGPLDECYLQISTCKVLWIGSAGFYLTEIEAKAVEEMFGPHGLSKKVFPEQGEAA